MHRSKKTPKKKKKRQPESAYAASITSWAYVGLGYVRLRATLHMGHAKMILRRARTRLVLRWGVDNQGGRARKAKIMLRLAGTAGRGTLAISHTPSVLVKEVV